MTDDRYLDKLQNDAKFVLPLYILVDHSYSMAMKDECNQAIDAANDMIPTIMDVCSKAHNADERARFCIIGFNSKAEVVAPLSRGTDLQPHKFEAEYQTDYAEAFRLLRKRLEEDYYSLKQDDFKVYRAMVFMITDGQPTSDPTEAFNELKDPDFQRSPNLTIIGIGKYVTIEDIKPYKIGRGKALLIKDTSAEEALSAIVKDLIQTVVNTANQDSFNQGSGDDDEIDGFIEDLLEETDMYFEEA
ncbi:VWA domain-containing protein [Corynebacterium sp. CCM 9204]|uniref:vWA domain-containing protein n=1 Tax=Corynebacterium sp. CCM 9204 TaxID=3057616 RepID=UPI003524227F